MTSLVRQARTVAADDEAPEATRIEAVRLLGTTSFDECGTLLLPLLGAGKPQTVQLAAVGALDAFTADPVGPELVKRFATLSPRVRGDALLSLLKRPERALALLRGIETGRVLRADG